MTYLLRCEGFEAPHPSVMDQYIGQYVETFRHDVPFGVFEGDFTGDYRRAMQFQNAGEALEFWRRISSKQPTRPDGKPNRPLSAMTAAIIKFEEAETTHGVG